jgi:hypothetical protein
MGNIEIAPGSTIAAHPGNGGGGCHRDRESRLSSAEEPNGALSAQPFDITRAKHFQA